MSDLVKVFDRHKQLTLSPQLVRFSRLGSAYRVLIKPKMPLGSLKPVVAEVNQAARDLVGTGKMSVKSPPTGPSGVKAMAKVAFTASLVSILSDIGGSVVGGAIHDDGQQTDDPSDSMAGIGTLLTGERMM